VRNNQAGGFGVCPKNGPALSEQPGMGAGAWSGQVQALAFDRPE
jgi:hypothetical protein